MILSSIYCLVKSNSNLNDSNIFHIFNRVSPKLEKFERKSQKVQVPQTRNYSLCGTSDPIKYSNSAREPQNEGARKSDALRGWFVSNSKSPRAAAQFRSTPPLGKIGVINDSAGSINELNEVN